MNQQNREQNEELSFTRNCPKCNKELSYSSKFTLKNAEDKNTSCKSCSLKGKGTGFKKGCVPANKGKPAWNKGLKGVQVAWNKGLTKETNQSVMQYCINGGISRRGRSAWNKGLTKETDERVALNVKKTGETLHKLHQEGIIFSPTIRPEVKKKLRETFQRKVVELGGFPNYNPIACKIFDDINKEMDWNGIHAMNGGEFKICGYWVDYYEPNLNIVIEYYENFHKNSIVRDEFRQSEIVKELNCKFYILKEWESLTWKEILNQQ